MEARRQLQVDGDVREKGLQRIAKRIIFLMFIYINQFVIS
jgi:hypothetical protein